MYVRESAMPDICSLSVKERDIFEFILDKWPTTTLEIAEHFGESISNRDEKKRASTKYSYYIKKLVDKNLVMTKKAGHSIIIWPLIVEKYRIIHSILKEDISQMKNFLGGKEYA